MSKGRTTIRTWIQMGNESLNVPNAVATLDRVGAYYYLLVTDCDGSESVDIDATDEAGAIEECRFAIETSEADQADRIESAAKDKAQELLDSLMDGGRVMDALKALRGL